MSLALLWACSDAKSPEENTASEVANISNSVTLSNEQIQAINIRTARIQQRNLNNVIKANGYVDVPPQNNAVISPLIPGYVRKVNFLVGDNVKKGQVMAELESMEFIDIQQQFAEQNAREGYLREEYERQKLLSAKDAVSKKTFLKSEVEYRTTVSTVAALKSKLALLGVNIDELSNGAVASRYLLRAPMAGSVSKMETMIGKYIDPSEEIFEIVDTKHMHLELQVYEQDAGKVAKGQKVWFKVPSKADSIYEGEVFLVGKDLSESKRSINVHVHIHGDESRFTVGMYANATIVTQENPSNTLPVTAVVTEGGHNYVFKKESGTAGEALFAKVPVITGMESDGLVELRSMEGLDENDEIVVNGAFYLINAFAGSE